MNFPDFLSRVSRWMPASRRRRAVSSTTLQASSRVTAIFTYRQRHSSLASSTIFSRVPEQHVSRARIVRRLPPSELASLIATSTDTGVSAHDYRSIPHLLGQRTPLLPRGRTITIIATFAGPLFPPSRTRLTCAAVLALSFAILATESMFFREALVSSSPQATPKPNTALHLTGDLPALRPFPCSPSLMIAFSQSGPAGELGRSVATFNLSFMENL
jgi:hypothetical protein